MIELLSPAGNYEKMKTAFKFGADACYMAGKRFGLRAMSANFTDDELKKSIEYAHSLNKKVYITLNILAHNEDFEGLKEYLEYLQEIKADGVIVSDLGIIGFAKKYTPQLEIHISTQTSITNKYTAKAFVEMGAKRLILARELSIEEIKEIRDYIPEDIVLEAFVHGAMCISYSGRCLLSNYLSGRDSNRGACIQACRFEYTITEKSRRGEEYEIQEDNRGTYILNSKDLNMIEHLDKLIAAGVTSFKIEGRMKSPYYVATVTNAYRRAIDYYLEGNKESYNCPRELVAELEKTSHRRYTTGFYFGAKDKEHMDTSNPIQTHEFIAIVTKEREDGWVEIEQRNRFKVGEELEILSPSEFFNKKIIVEKMTNLDGKEILDASLVQQKILLNCKYKLQEGDILRRAIAEKSQ